MVISSRYELDTDVSFFYTVFTQTHGLAFNNELTRDPIKPHWLDFQKNICEGYNAWFKYWINVAENTDIPVYFFRFEDAVKNPGKELKNIFRFVLGLDSLEGTIIEHRIDEVMKWSASRN